MSVLPQTSNGTPPSAATLQQPTPHLFIEPAAPTSLVIPQDAEKFTSQLLQQNMEISKLAGEDVSVRALLDDNLRIVFLVGTGQDGKTTLYKSMPKHTILHFLIILRFQSICWQIYARRHVQV